MKKIICIVLCILWTVLCGAYFVLNAYGLLGNFRYSYRNDSYYYNGGLHVIDNVGDEGYILKIDDLANVTDVIDVEDYIPGARCEALSQSGPLALLVSINPKLEDEELDITALNIVVFDRDGVPVKMCDWITPDRECYPLDLYLDGDDYRVTFLSPTQTYAYHYVFPGEDFYDIEDGDIPSVRNVDAVEVSAAESNSNKIYRYEVREDDFAREAYRKKKLTVSQIAHINHDLLVNSLASCIIGVIILIIAYILLKRRNRVAYLVLLWEIMTALLCLSFRTGMLVLTGKYGFYIGLALFFVIASVIGVVIIIMMSLDISLLIEAMRNVACGEMEIKKPATIGDDVESAWNALFDIVRIIRNIHYSKYRIFEAYYKFAPKNIEDILGRESILEVRGGDTAKGTGTIGLISSKITAPSPVYDTAFKLFADCQESKKGSLVSAGHDLSQFTMLFPDSNTETIPFGAELIRLAHVGAENRTRMTMLLMHGDYIYGSVGDVRHQVPFLNSFELSAGEANIELLSELGLRLVVTEDVKEREGADYLVRFIGYLAMTSDRLVKLYEVLDALPAEVRRQRKLNDEAFQNGIRLFADKDYYIARREFAKVIKADPDDTVARWYLFNSEKYLNNPELEAKLSFK